jgi:hypothetical protein
MIEDNIISFIKTNYPSLTFNNVKTHHTNQTNALGFIISKDQLIIGYIDHTGELLKLVDPINPNDLTRDKLVDIIKKIPTINTFEGKIKLLDILEEPNVKQVESQNVIQELRDHLKSKDLEYKIYLDKINTENNNNIILIKTEHTQRIEEINKLYNKKITEFENQQAECKDRLLYEKDVILQAINDYRSKFEDQFNIMLKNAKSQNYTNLQMGSAFKKLSEMYNVLLKDKQEIEKTLDVLYKRERNTINKIQEDEDLLSDYSYQLQNSNETISKLNNNIKEIQEELSKIKEDYSNEKLKTKILEEFKRDCLDRILKEKDLISNSIKNYTLKWEEWANVAIQNKDDIDNYKDKLRNDLSVVFNNLKQILEYKNSYINNLTVNLKTKQSMINELNSSISKIKLDIKQSVDAQLVLLQNKNQILSQKESEQLVEIKDLKETIKNLKELLLEEQSTKITTIKIPNNDNCVLIFQNFIVINNSFYRKKEIIKKIDELIANDKINVPGSLKESIIAKYTLIRDYINKIILFLDLDKYANDPVTAFFKNKSDFDKIPPEFCNELNNISEFWLENNKEYLIQTQLLSNLAEDLLGAVRVYIKIKPLSKELASCITATENSISVTPLEGEPKTFSNFFGIFDPTYTNSDVYTGNKSVIANKNFKFDKQWDDILPGIHHSFKQVEEGYSIVIFGYGASGSGKTASLIGTLDSPGLIYYGLNNLNGVTNIKVKNIFEQYIKDFVPTLNKIKGRIHNLYNDIPKLRDFSIDETKEFNNENSGMGNFNINDLPNLLDKIEKYRISKKRIKKTPNNPVSSRSNLYIVFEIKFDTGKTGYITIVDTAGTENPIDIYNTFITPNKLSIGTNLTNVLGPTGSDLGSRIKSECKNNYVSSDIIKILREGFYINEMINHTAYFFNSKSGINKKIVSQSNLDNYDPSRFYINPLKEMESIDPNNTVLTIPILKYLDSLVKVRNPDSEWKPTKFITLVCVRQEIVYSTQTINSLKLATKISS